ncbi:hypothetical protein SAMN05192566_1555 [Methylophilus rhizosphaerae]|uniref:Uncharacterized protein n=1 Tax=Methylophilus rhizosphaerae TaxID=492660 RepID=A0A1G9CNV5_9PROT|nr:hypothetical protein [Methylophilus rhizosphaerae]SDK53338.1 hypothetical protein SAMN05192566_1555 [Methylophilus rhizosphaerae]
MRIFATSLIVSGLIIVVSAFNMLNGLAGNLFDIVLLGERYTYLAIGAFITLLGGVLFAAQPNEIRDDRPLLDKYLSYWEAIWHGEKIMAAAVFLVFLSLLLPWQLTENIDYAARLQVSYGGVLLIAVLWSYPLAAILLRQSLKPARYLLLNIISFLLLIEQMMIYTSHFIQFQGEGLHQLFNVPTGAALFLYANLLCFSGIVFDMQQEGKLFD